MQLLTLSLVSASVSLRAKYLYRYKYVENGPAMGRFLCCKRGEGVAGFEGIYLYKNLLLQAKKYYNNS